MPRSAVQQNHPLPPALPENIQDWQRSVEVEPTLNDLVETIHRALVSDPQYRKYLRACWDEQAEEGSLAADNFELAGMIRNKAREMEGFVEVANSKKATIVKSLNVVLRRYNASRKERRNRLGGTQVPNPNENGE